MKPALFRLMVIVVLSFIVSQPSFATSPLKCKAYRDAYCPGIKNLNDLNACLQEKANSIPCSCREQFGLHATVVNKAECSADKSKFCSGVSKKGGELIKCLSEHQGEISCECRENLLLVKSKLRESGMNCEKDRRKFCGDTTPGDGRVKKCLKSHKKDLSDACSTGLKTVKKYKL